MVVVNMKELMKDVGLEDNLNVLLSLRNGETFNEDNFIGFALMANGDFVAVRRTAFNEAVEVVVTANSVEADVAAGEEYIYVFDRTIGDGCETDKEFMIDWAYSYNDYVKETYNFYRSEYPYCIAVTAMQDDTLSSIEMGVNYCAEKIAQSEFLGSRLKDMVTSKCSLLVTV